MSKSLSFAILTLCSGIASLGLLLAGDPAFAGNGNGNGNGGNNSTSTPTPTPNSLAQTTAPIQSATTSFTVGLADLGKIFRVNFDGNVDTKTVNGLSSFADFTFNGFTTQAGKTIANFNVLLDNTTSGGILSRVSGLGFNTSATVTKATSTGLFGNGVLNAKLPNQFGDIGVCFSDGNCTGGQNGGVSNNASLPGTFDKGTFSFSLELGSKVDSLTLSNFGVRYQSIDAKSVGVSGTSGTGRGTSVTTVNPPASNPPAPNPPAPNPPAPNPPAPNPPAPNPPAPNPPAPNPPAPNPPAPNPPAPNPPAPQPPLFDQPIDGTPPSDQPTPPNPPTPTPPKPPTPKPTKVPEPGMIAALSLVGAIALRYRKQQESDAEV